MEGKTEAQEQKLAEMRVPNDDEGEERGNQKPKWARGARSTEIS